MLGALYLVLPALASHLPNPWWLICLASFVMILPVQQAAHRVNEGHRSVENPNTSYTAADVVVIVIGALLLILSVVGAFEMGRVS